MATCYNMNESHKHDVDEKTFTHKKNMYGKILFIKHSKQNVRKNVVFENVYLC